MRHQLKSALESTRYGGLRVLRLCVVAACFGGIVVAFDYLYGEASGIASMREDARRFRAEAASLRIPTRALVPDLHHRYPDPYRPEGDAFLPRNAPRLFDTTPEGTVSAGSGPQDGDVRVLFLGGSTTECNEVDEQFRFPAVVARNLRDAGVAAAVTNAGVRGHTTLDAINTLLNRPDLTQANVVVLMENINDRLLLAIRGRYGEELSAAAPTTFAAVRGAAIATLASAWEYLAYRSNVLFLAQSVGDRFGGGHTTERGYVTERTLEELPPPSLRAQALYAQNLKIFVTVVRALGKTPALMTQPLGKRSVGQELFNDIVRTVANDSGALLIDLDILLPSDRGWAYLGDDIHFSNRGSREIGNLITAALAPQVGAGYLAPPADTGLVSLAALAETCPVADAPGNSPPSPRLFQIVGDGGRYPSVSADGRWLLFQARPSSFDRIRALRLKDHRLFELSPPDVSVHERHPAFLETSASEFSIVFGHGAIGEQGGHERLMVRSWPSGRTMPLYDDADLTGSIPSVLGRAVYFAGSKDRAGSHAPNLYRFDRDHQTIERLTESHAEEWRPYGGPSDDVYFISDVDGRFSIYRRDARTGKSKKVVSSSADEWDPAVSPDGKWLAFASKRHGSWDIFIAPTADLSKQRRLTSLSGDEWDPAWHPNGRVLLLGSAQSREPKIMALCPFGDPVGTQ